MAFQGRSIQASVELDLAPLELSITKANEMLQGLGGAFEFKREPLVQLEQYMGKVRDIFKMVSDEALKINEAFNNIQGLKTFIENLEILKVKMETIANDVDKINQAILKESESATKVGEAEQRINTIMQSGLDVITRTSAELSNNVRLIKEQVAQEERELQVLNEVALLNEQSMNWLMGKATSISQIVAEEEKELAVLREVESANTQMMEVLKGRATSVTDIIAMTDEELALLREELALEEEILGIEKQQTGEIGKQNAERTGAKGNKLDKMGYLPSRIGSMAITMLGYQEIMDVWEKTTSNVNAKTQFNSYADLLKTDNRYLKQTKQSTADVTKGINELNKALYDTYKGGDSLQRQYQKVDMKMVGANALDTAFKYGVQADALGDLTEVMAIYSSEFVRQGRSQEDSILAVNDALDGEFRRLKEVNIGKEELEAHGYKEGDQLSLIKAMRDIASERGYDVTAKKITTLSEAINVAELELAFLLSDLFELVEPSFIYALEKIVDLFRWLGDGLKQVKEYLQGLPQPTKEFLKQFGGNLMLAIVGVWIGKKIFSAITNIGLFGDAWTKLMEKLGRTKGMDKATESMGKMGQTTGGTAPTGGGNWKDGLKNWGKNLAKNLGKMAEVFIEVAVALVMAWALMEEAMILIARIGDDYESMKPSFDKGAKFLKEYGIYILAVGGAMAVLLQYTDKLPQTDWKSQAKAFGKLALGLAEAMVLIGEAIVLLIVPLKAIEVLGWMYGMLNQANIQKGNEVIGMYADALNYIASNDNIGYFIIGLTVASAVFGFSGDTVAVGMAVGIATALLLVAEAIVMLITPLVAVEMLGNMASELNEDAINKGAEVIGTIGRVLQTLAPVVGDLVAVDWGVFADQLINLGNKIMNGGKDGLTTLVETIIPSLNDFVTKFNQIEFSDTGLNADSVAKITQTANAIAPMISAVNNLTSLLGGDTSISFMGIKIETNTGIRGKLDQLYEDVSAVMDFANKLGNLKTTDQVGTTAITQTSDAISQLKAKLDQFVNTISSYSDKVHTASDRLGKSLPNGFKSGASTFSATVVTVLASGISEVQARYPTMNNGGKALGQKLVDGFKNHKPSLKTIVSKEIDYALDELDDAKDDFYSKGQALGKQLSDGFESEKGLNVGSPANIARTIAKEMEYSMLALDNGKQLMYQGGVALGQALTNGYNSYGNLKTDVGVLASKGINSEQLQANATSVQANTKGKGKTQQSLTPTINIDMSNSTIIGIQDLNTRIQNAVETAIVRMNSPNGATGY